MVDWDEVFKANPEEIQELEDETAINRWCDGIRELDAGKEADVVKLRKGFIIAQALLTMKAMESEVYKEENENLTKEFETVKRRERQQQDEIRVLENEIVKIKKYSQDNLGSGTIDHTRILRQELDAYERDIQLIKEELASKERLVERERIRADDLQAKNKQLESTNDGLRKDNERQQSDIEDYIQRLKSLTDAGQGRRHDDLVLREKLQEKNKELLALNNEYINIATRNQYLEEEVKRLTIKMEDATAQMNKFSDDYMKLEAVLHSNDSILDSFKKDNEKLTVQVQDLTERLKSKADTDDEIMIAVNNKVEEWTKLLAIKDAELLEYREQALKLQEKITALSMDSERAKLAALERGIEERDAAIKVLQDQLKVATQTLEHDNAIIKDRQAQLNKDLAGPGSSDVHIKKIKALQGTLKDQSNQTRSLEDRVLQAERDTKEKEKEVNELLERMRQYESGKYGLTEAVIEIKDLKQQLQIRDRQIVELTQNINKLSNQINDLADENDALRDKLGMGPTDTIDLSNARSKKNQKKEEEKALNQVLQMEVEKLEEERLSLKQQIRKLAQDKSQRAVALGLTTDDVLAIEEFTETLKTKRVNSDVIKVKQAAETDELKIRNLQLAQESEKYQKDMDRIRQTNAELNLKVRELEGENKKLEQGLKEILQSVKDSQATKADGGLSVAVESPTLDRMLAAIEAKQLTGNYDAALQLKAQVDNLTGRNEELRRELRESRLENSRVKVDLEKALGRVTKLEDDIKIVKNAGGMGMLFQTLALPAGMAVSSADVIASLNEHLVQTLHELSQKEELLSKMEQGLEVYKGRFAVCRHQLGLLYKQHSEESKAWQDDIANINQKMKEQEASISEDKLRIHDYNRLVDTLAQDESEVRRRLADMTRKMTVLRVNEKALARRYAMMQEVEASLRKDITRLSNENISMQAAVTERLGYLQRFKDMASFKIASLQKMREESVPLSELEEANSKYQELTEKYRDLLERNNNMVAKNENTAFLEMEIKRLQYERDGLTKELEIEKEKTHAYQASFEQLQKQGIAMTGTFDHEAATMAKKLATLEMKELNERQRAEHAVRMYEQRKETLLELERRNNELEQKFAEVVKVNLDAQRTERQLRDELSNCVLKKVSDADRARIAELEATENSLKIENSRLKEVADVAVSQYSSVEQQKVNQEKELLSLRQQLLDFQSQSDEKKVIGKLHRQLVLLQVSEGTAIKKLEEANKAITKLQAQLLRFEQRLDERDQALSHHRAETANKIRHLRRTVHELRRMYSGSVPVSTQERFAKAMMQLQQDKESFAQQLKQTSEDREAVASRLAALNLQYTSLQELVSTLKDGKGANKVIEWHGKMESLRLEDLKKTRQIQRLTEQSAFMENSVRKHEVTISNLEEELVKLNRHHEERQLQWEQREMEMERIINKLENQQQVIAGAASKFEEAAGVLPDITLPLSEQLEQSIVTIKNNVRIILETQAESKKLKQENGELKQKLKDADSNLLSRDRLISELRLRMPATAERDAAIAKATANAKYQEESYETKQALKVAQSTVSSLQARIAQKEETIDKLQNLLKQARDEMADLCNKHETDMKLMMDRLHIKSDDAFVKFKQTATHNVNQQPPSVPTNKQLARLNELEDTVIQQDNQIAALSERVRGLQAESEKWRKREENTTITFSKDKEKLIEEHHMLVQKLDTENDDLRRQLSEQKEAVKRLSAVVEREKEAAIKGPSSSAKELINKLKQQLQEKEDELQNMSRALTELRSDLVKQAEEAVRFNATNAAQDWNIQKLIDKRTKDLNEKIQDLESALQQAKGEGRKKIDNENRYKLECEELKDELSRKEASTEKLRDAKRRLEEQNEFLEKKLDRFMANKTQTGGGSKQELESLRNQVKSLEQQLSDNKLMLNRAEKPSEELITQAAVQKTMALEKWEEGKKYQKQFEKAKARLLIVEADCEKLKTNNEQLKNALERANKSKEALEKKVNKNAPPVNAAAPSSLTEQELRDQNQMLRDEISDLRQQLMMTRDVAYEEVQIRNRQLTDKLEQLEKVIQQKKSEQPPVIVGDDYAEKVAREQKLQAEVLKLSEENLSLRFEVTQLQQEIPNLKEKIESQKQYIEVLKAEKNGIPFNTARSVNSWISGSSEGSIKKLGESGRTPKELEKTISLLKKVVEKKQSEIDQLKMAPGVISNENFFELEMENRGLKEQNEELRLQMGAKLAERYEMKDKGTRKLTTDFEKLRKDLRKEQETGEKLKVALNSARLTAEQYAKTIEELRAKLGIAESKVTSTQNMDQKEWKAAVVTRMSEEKLVKVLSELDSKNKALADIKVLLKDSATREKSLLNEKEELQRKIAILERFPPGSKLTDSEVMAQLQQAKLSIKKLEEEKTELMNDLRRTKGHVVESFNETVMEKARKYDSALQDQVETSTKLQSIMLENEKLKKELANFGPEFFEEIEDMKYNYKEALIKNEQLETKLSEICLQFGISL